MMDSLKKDKRFYILIICTALTILIFIFDLCQSKNLSDSLFTALSAWAVNTSIMGVAVYIDTKKKRLNFLEELDKELEDDLKAQEKYED